MNKPLSATAFVGITFSVLGRERLVRRHEA